MSESIITWSWPNFITVGLIAVTMMAVLGFLTSAASRAGN